MRWINIWILMTVRICFWKRFEFFFRRETIDKFFLVFLFFLVEFSFIRNRDRSNLNSGAKFKINSKIWRQLTYIRVVVVGVGGSNKVKWNIHTRKSRRHNSIEINCNSFKLSEVSLIDWWLAAQFEWNESDVFAG